MIYTLIRFLLDALAASVPVVLKKVSSLYIFLHHKAECVLTSGFTSQLVFSPSQKNWDCKIVLVVVRYEVVLRILSFSLHCQD